jgi:hypothetical protein
MPAKHSFLPITDVLICLPELLIAAAGNGTGGCHSASLPPIPSSVEAVDPRRKPGVLFDYTVDKQLCMSHKAPFLRGHFDTSGVALSITGVW